MEVMRNGFKNSRLGIELDVYVIEGKEWFKAQDISEILVYQDTRHMSRNVEINDRNSYLQTLETAQGNKYEALFINESVLYEIIFRITKRDIERYSLAREFQKWVFEEVLPSLRKNNFYIDKENITSKQFEDLQKEIIDLTQQRDNFKNILVNNKRKKQRLKTFLEDMFPECEDVYEQFLWNMYDKGTLDGSFMPTEKFIKQNESKNMFIHITKTNKEVTHDLILTNVGMAELSQRLYLENTILKIKVDKKRE